jgi:N-acetylneuraminic acid mutarotase
MGKIAALLLVLVFLTASCIIAAKSAFSSASGAENSWVSKASMPTARSGLGVAAVNGKIYAIGGNGGYIINEEYDPASNTWISKKPMPTGRSIFGIAVYENKIYVVGGSSGALPITGINEVYDPETDTWETKAPMPTPRHSLVASVAKGRIYLIGGIKDPTTGDLSNLNEVYDPTTNTWAAKAPIPEAISRSASAVIDNKIYLIGSKLQICDPETDTWSYGAPPPYPGVGAAGATSGVWAPKRIYYIVPREDAINPKDYSNFNQAYNPADDSWEVGSRMPTSRFDFAIAVVNDRLYAIGGLPYITFSPNQPHSAENEEYTPFGFGTSTEPQQSQPFPTTWIAIAIVIVAAVGIGLLVYFEKRKHQAEHVHSISLF